MDIHKPKPWHGVREFLKEYVIIVVGVLTALGAEQGVEWLHWRHVLAEAREALAADQVRNLQWAGEREAQSACVAHEARALGAALDRADETGRLPAVFNVTGPARRPWTLNSYDAIVSSQALAHLPMRERLLFTLHHGWSVYLMQARETEAHDWTVLRAMEGPGRKVGEAEIATLRAALSEAIQQQEAIRAGSREFSHRIDQTRLLSPKAAAQAWQEGEENAHRYWACGAAHTGRNEYWLRSSETPSLPFPAFPPDSPNAPQP
jgi:hypothetical protein